MTDVPTARPRKFSAKALARVGTIVLAISQCFPFDKGYAWVSHENEDPLTTGGGRDSIGAYHSGYDAEISHSGGEAGFQSHPYAWFVLLLFVIYFFTPLVRRPGWGRWAYWAAVVLSLACTEFPPPFSMMGGLIATAGLALMIYAAYINGKTQAPTPPPAA
jgi:hypothetical protein